MRILSIGNYPNQNFNGLIKIKDLNKNTSNVFVIPAEKDEQILELYKNIFKNMFYRGNLFPVDNLDRPQIYREKGKALKLYIEEMTKISGENNFVKGLDISVMKNPEKNMQNLYGVFRHSNDKVETKLGSKDFEIIHTRQLNKM